MLWSALTIQQFIAAMGGDLGPCGFDGHLGGETAYCRRFIRAFEAKNNLTQDSGIWGAECQHCAQSLLTKGIPLTPNFNSREFGCGLCPGDDAYPDHSEGCHHFPDMVNLTAVKMLQAVRDRLGPIQITSGLRCQAFNDSLPGSIKTSAHRRGRAFDVSSCNGKTLGQIYETARACGFSNTSYIGVGFCHLQYDGPGF